MLNNIIDKNIVFLQNYGVKMSNDDDKAVYRYGLQILYYYIIDLVVVFSLAAIFGRLYETVIMTFIFALFQVFGGGYHAKTPLKCLLIMVAGAAVGNVLIILTADRLIINMALVAVLSGIILILTPVANKKHPVSKKVKQRSTLIIRVAVGLLTMIAFILYYLDKSHEVATISVTLCLYVVSLITAKIYEKKGK